MFLYDSDSTTTTSVERRPCGSVAREARVYDPAPVADDPISYSLGKLATAEWKEHADGVGIVYKGGSSTFNPGPREVQVNLICDSVWPEDSAIEKIEGEGALSRRWPGGRVRWRAMGSLAGQASLAADQLRQRSG